MHVELRRGGGVHFGIFNSLKLLLTKAILDNSWKTQAPLGSWSCWEKNVNIYKQKSGFIVPLHTHKNKK